MLHSYCAGGLDSSGQTFLDCQSFVILTYIKNLG